MSLPFALTAQLLQQLTPIEPLIEPPGLLLIVKEDASGQRQIIDRRLMTASELAAYEALLEAELHRQAAGEPAYAA